MILGVSGYARAGKDTVAGILTQYHGFERLAFADVLKESLYLLNPYVAPWQDLKSLVDDIGWEGIKDGGSTKQIKDEVRRLQQAHGNTMRDLVGEDVWVEATFRKMEQGKRYVISDARYQNEANRIVARGGYVIRVERPGVGPVNDHISEVDLDGYQFDAVIQNDGSLERLGEKVAHWIGQRG